MRLLPPLPDDQLVWVNTRGSQAPRRVGLPDLTLSRHLREGFAVIVIIYKLDQSLLQTVPIPEMPRIIEPRLRTGT